MLTDRLLQLSNPLQLACCVSSWSCCAGNAADRAAVVQLNYQLISQDAHVHRSIAQRLITEMLQRLAMHIVAGHAIQVCTAVKLGTGCTGQFTSMQHLDTIQLQQLLSAF